jgi:hypothetical protein
LHSINRLAQDASTLKESGYARSITRYKKKKRKTSRHFHEVAAAADFFRKLCYITQQQEQTRERDIQNGSRTGALETVRKKGKERDGD